MSQKILRLPSVKVLTGLSRSSIYKKVSEGTFPRPVSLGARAVGWYESQVNDWLENLTLRRQPLSHPRLDRLSYLPNLVFNNIATIECP